MFKWALRENRPEACLLVVGTLTSVIEGGIWPAFSILFAEIITTMVTDNDPKDMRDWSIGFVGLGAGVFLVLFIKLSCLTLAGERLTARLRSKSFQAIIYQTIPWFDDPAHSKVCSLLFL